MVYTVNKLENGEVLTIAFEKHSVWDAKAAAVRETKAFIVNKDGKNALETSYNLSIKDISGNGPVNRHSFRINEKTGCLEVYHITTPIIKGWPGDYAGAVMEIKIYELSVNHVYSKHFYKIKIS